MAYRPLSERLDFFGITPNDTAHKGVSRAIDRRIERALDEFYAELKSREELMSMFSSPEAIDRARGAQAKHWKGAFRDGITESFRNRA
ncbi:MAG: protoglobin domain-containing protein, partial [Pseudomonadota bacterium]